MLRVAGLALLLLAVSSCTASGDDDDEGGQVGPPPDSQSSASSPPPDSQSSASPPPAVGSLVPVQPVRGRAAATALRRAFSEFSSQGYVSFRHITTMLDRTISRVDGDYSFEDDAWRATRKSYELESDVEYVMHARSVGGVVWMQMEGWKNAAECWLVMSRTQTPLGVTAMSTAQPGYVRVVSGLQSTGFDPGDSSMIVGEMTLRAFSQLLPGQVLAQIAPYLEAEIGNQSVPARIGLEGGALHSVEVSGEEALAVFQGISRELPVEVTTFFDITNHRLEYPPDARPARVEQPPADRVFTPPSRSCKERAA